MAPNPALFWDTDPSGLEPEKHARFIIARVLMRGTMRDWVWLREQYGMERIANEATEIRYLDKKTLAFCSNYFNIPKERFRCFTARLSTPQLWDF